MDKEQIKSLISRYVREGKLNHADIMSAYNEGVGDYNNENTDSNEKVFWNISNILYGLGSLVVIVGILILIANNWNELSDFSKLSITIGIGIMSYISAVLIEHGESLTKSRNHYKVIGISSVLFLISSILIPFGTIIFFEIFSIDNIYRYTALSLGLFISYGFTLFLFRRSILILTTLFFGITSYYGIIGHILHKGLLFDYENIYTYATIALSVSILIIGYVISHSIWKRIPGFIYSLGTVALLSSILSLGGLFNNSDLFWDVLFVPAVVFLFWLSSRLRSMSVLVWSSVFLVIFLSKITSEYFVHSLGWPFALVLIGFILIGVGYGTFRLGKTFNLS